MYMGSIEIVIVAKQRSERWAYSYTRPGLYASDGSRLIKKLSSRPTRSVRVSRSAWPSHGLSFCASSVSKSSDCPRLGSRTSTKLAFGRLSGVAIFLTRS